MEKNKNKAEEKKDKETIETPATSVPSIPSAGDSLAELKKEIESLKEQNQSLSDLLLQVADKKQLAIYYQKHQQKVPPTVKLRTIKGKVIIGWRTVKDEVYQDPATRRWVEEQIVEVMFEDGSSKQYPLLDYVRLYQHINAQVISTVTDSDGRIAFKVKADNGKEYVISAEFVN